MNLGKRGRRTLARGDGLRTQLRKKLSASSWHPRVIHLLEEPTILGARHTIALDVSHAIDVVIKHAIELALLLARAKIIREQPWSDGVQPIVVTIDANQTAYSIR
ncbi:hypothetical protein JF66_18760 [Cryobacterium sp. MLB-32]|uniref:hypothetical protein n=1 Tax=Cryobacterium sp. MLB-32 TaxID=1529318 RepID=UPI0004E6B483|nr:hypothetical protein [Cryobacterium sp. MLB-32]KFF58419.1 hypothetical protein JF66_18760 [Cryobacterium sp. MLB-32]